FQAALQMQPKGSTYGEYALFLYQTYLEQPEKIRLNDVEVVLIQALAIEDDSGLSYDPIEIETVPPCLRPLLLATPDTPLIVKPSVLAQYLLVCCYCHQNKPVEAQAALEELEKSTRPAPTKVNQALYATAQSAVTALKPSETQRVAQP